MFYTIIIYPLVQIIEFIFLLGRIIFENDGLAIICVSTAVTFLSLPLYIVAEKWQQTERETMRRLKPKIDKIKAVFTGDEQYMILSTYYRQNHYHPVYALRNSFGILIQMPFFIAAYVFLSNLERLSRVSFFFIHDLSLPDRLLSIGPDIHINVLPVLMTVINCAAGAVYTRNLQLRDKIQVYSTAAVFLVLLYNSPACLVLYWTMNNIFSLVKNIFYKLKKPALVLYILLCFMVFVVDYYVLFVHLGDIFNRLIIVITSAVVPLSPFFIKMYNFVTGTALQPLRESGKRRLQLFIVSLGICCLITGFVLPSYAVSSSPQEFSYIESVASPFTFLGTTFVQAFGLFFFWPVCLYCLFGEKIKTLLTVLAVLAGWGALINAFCFSGNYGTLSSMLTFSDAGLMKPTPGIAVINIAALVLLTALVIFLISRDERPLRTKQHGPVALAVSFLSRNGIRLVSTFSFIILLALAGISAVHSVTIEREFRRLTAIRGTSGSDKPAALSTIFHFSPEGKNVLVIMLDKALNVFVPEIFAESPELYHQFEGFTYYPNTLSFNGHTLIGAPPLFGGYEYTPEAMNKRSGEPLVKKHNESLLLMPHVFSANGFAVTITDPPWANYSWLPDTRIFSGYPGITVKNTQRTYTDTWLAKNNFVNSELQVTVLKRNFIWFSLFKSSPLILRDAIYKNGEWWSTDTSTNDFRSILNNYATLDLLPLLTDTSVSTQNTFTIFVNELPHDETLFLKAPDYVPAPVITRPGNSKYAGFRNYSVNAATLKRLGTWFDYLRANGVYNNSRIIIAADHGANIYTGVFANYGRLPFNRETFNPLLMVKDFDDVFPFKSDNSFMTNADVPALAFRNLVHNPVNPFTGNSVDTAPKSGRLLMTTSDKFMPGEHHANTFRIAANEWYSVHSGIFDSANWQQAEE